MKAQEKLNEIVQYFPTVSTTPVLISTHYFISYADLLKVKKFM